MIWLAHPLAYSLGLLLADARVRATVVSGPEAVEVVLTGARYVFRRPAPGGARDTETGDGALAASMPGTVLEVRCRPGETVAAGQVLAVLEAMKMEMSIRAPFDGVVGAVAVGAGDQVQLGAPLLKVQPVADENEPTTVGV